MDTLFFLSFFVHGLTSIIAQVTILRELMVTFYGNELFMGASLGFWLLGGGLGSYLANKISPKKISLKDLLSLNLVLLALELPTEIVLIRLFKGKFFLPGEIPNFLIGFVFTFLILLPFCFILDAFFTLATRFWAKKQKRKKQTAELISRAYLWEIIGLAIGGLGFNFFLIKLVEFKILFLLSALSLLVAAKIGKWQFLKFWGLTSFCLALFWVFSPLSSTLNIQTLKLIHPDLIKSVNSKYGRITITHSGPQYNFFESGSLVGTEKDFEASEYFVHFILNFHPNPEKILLIGGGFNGVISEILKYKTIKKVDYVELDPSFLVAIQKYLPNGLQEALLDPRVNINYLDGRKFLKETKAKYDLIVFLLPNPSTTLLNRFYTKECFEKVKNLLEEKGMFVFSLDVPVDYLSLEAEKVVSSLFWTARSVFPETLVFPETNSLFLASKETITTDPQVLSERFRNRDIKTNFITSEYFYYRTKSDHIPRFGAIFQQNQDIKLNLDFFPTAYFYQIAFWQTQFSFLLAKIFRNLVRLDWYVIFALIYLPFGFLLCKAKKTSLLAPILVGTAGFSLMVFETLTIFAFQATLGFLFTKVSLIFTAFLFSIGLGNIVATRSLKQASKKLKITILLLVFYCPFYLLLLNKIRSEFPFYLLSMIIGSLVGAVFPLANQVFLAKDKKAALKTGVLYSADLFGAFCGAISTSIFLIPILGVHQTVYLTMAINILLFLYLLNL